MMQDDANPRHRPDRRAACRAGLLALMLLAGAYAPGSRAGPESGAPAAAGEPLDDFDRLELHARRYRTAAHGTAELIQQLDRRIQDVSLAAQAVESKGSSHNRHVLEEKLRQLENARTVASRQYGQLRIQMQNEYRSLAAASEGLKARYAPAKVRGAGGLDAAPDDLDPGAPLSDPRLRDAQVLDLDPAELRARRDAPEPPFSPAPSR